MTIIATQLSLVLGAWRIRLRFDIDEPRDEPRGARTPRSRAPHAGNTPVARYAERVAPWGRG